MSNKKFTREDIERIKKSYTDKGLPIPQWVLDAEKKLNQN